MKKVKKIGIIGLGYVGLPLALEFNKKYNTIGFDNNLNRINELKKGIDRTTEINESDLQNSNLIVSNKIKDISDCNIYIITVPTPIDKYNNPNTKPLCSATKMVGAILSKSDLVIYESTVYPGATEELCVPILEKESNLKYNKDFFCGYSPERINPGDKDHSIKSIIKVTSGSTDETSSFVDKLYQSIIVAGTYKASSIPVAEAAKVIENIQRDVNIALINEFSMLFNKLNLNTNEILEAAKTKWNFLPFKPGLVGGHCIGVDPYYLTHKASEIGFNPEMILAGRRINDNMGQYVAESTILEMVNLGISPIRAKVAVFGITFKENCPDLRNSKVINVIENLISYECDVIVTDPLANEAEVNKKYNISIKKMEKIDKIDCLIIAVPHKEYLLINKNEWLQKLNKKAAIIDIKGVLDQTMFDSTNYRYWQL